VPNHIGPGRTEARVGKCVWCPQIHACRQLRHKRWNLRICERYEDPTRVLNYLGRYVHGGPIGQSRLLAFDGQSVTFRYKDYRDIGPDAPREKVPTLMIDEFVFEYDVKTGRLRWVA
jgi:hypothetical protein